MLIFLYHTLEHILLLGLFIHYQVTIGDDFLVSIQFIAKQVNFQQSLDNVLCFL